MAFQSGIWRSIVARISSDFASNPDNALDFAKLSLPQMRQWLSRTERDIHAALAKAEAARRRASKLQQQFIDLPDTETHAQLERELQQAQSYAAHADRLSEVHSRMQSKLVSTHLGANKRGDSKP